MALLRDGAHPSPQELSPRRSLITVSYNSAEALRTWWSGFTADALTEWIVVDNGSTDDSVEFARSRGARVITLKRNRGFSWANNEGLRAARGDLIGFVNPDVRITPEALDEIELSTAELPALVSPQLYYADGAIQHNGRGYPLLTAKIRNRLRGGDPKYLLSSDPGAPRPVAWLMGASIFGRKDVFERLGAWDPTFFLYYEDSDICLRAWREGIPVLLLPGPGLTHGWARETAGRFRFTPWRRELASMTRFYARYPELLLGPRAARRAHPELDRAVFGETV